MDTSLNELFADGSRAPQVLRNTAVANITVGLADAHFRHFSDEIGDSYVDNG
jgi:hypothetical protein